jgi:hypothetical protein
MGVVGLEPTRFCNQRILSPQRLPFRHTPRVVSQRSDPSQYRGRTDFLSKISIGLMNIIVYSITNWPTYQPN